MPFDRPTLRVLSDRVRADLRAYTAGGDALLRRSVERVLTRVLAGLTHGLHGHVAWVARQILPDGSEEDGVLRWARILGITPRPAAPAVCGDARFATTGPAIPIDHLVQRADGVAYLVTAATVVGGEVTVELVAAEPGGTGNAPTATPLSLVSPVAGVASAGVVVDPDGIHGGTEVEDVESLRGRVLLRLGYPPRGGGPGDYVAWALEVPGVTRAWERPRVAGAGTVGVQFATDDDGIIPGPAKVSEVAAHIASRAPVTVGRSIEGEWVGVIVTAPGEHAIDPEIHVEPDTPEVRAAVDAELVDFLRREGAPGLRVPISRFREAISAAEGEYEHVLVGPLADIEPAPGHLPVLGVITWA